MGGTIYFVPTELGTAVSKITLIYLIEPSTTSSTVTTGGLCPISTLSGMTPLLPEFLMDTVIIQMVGQFINQIGADPQSFPIYQQAISEHK